MSYDFLFRFEIGRGVILTVGSNPTLSAIWSVATDCASLFVFMGILALLDFVGVACFCVFNGQFVWNGTDFCRGLEICTPAGSPATTSTRLPCNAT